MNSRNTAKMVEHKFVLFATFKAFWTLVTLLIIIQYIIQVYAVILVYNDTQQLTLGFVITEVSAIKTTLLVAGRSFKQFARNESNNKATDKAN